ncbi:MAG: hypothetical protein IJ911_14170 [Salinivirgaceae bacterium]|nr:hypothetical protein [Salinivirgaceae bacterium]
MCTYSVKIDDAVLERAKPHFKGSNAMQAWIEQQLEKALVEYTNRLEQQHLKKTDSTHLMDELKRVEGDSDAFFKLGGILGSPANNFSWEQLREDAIGEKYGI